MLRLIVFLAILLPGVVASLRSRYAALLLYFWYALFRPQDWIWIDIEGLRLSLVLGALLLVPSLATGLYPTLSHPLSIGAIVFFLAALGAQFNAIAPDVGWYWLDFLVKLLLVSTLATTIVNDRRRLLNAIMVLGLSFGFHGAKAGLASLLAGGVRFPNGPGGAYIDNNGYGIAMAMIAPFLLCVAQNTKVRAMRWGCAVAVPLVAIGVVGTYSRSAFLALLAATLTVIMFQRRRVGWLLLAIVIAVPIGLFMSTQEGYFDRMATIRTYNEVNETSAMSRPHFWSVAVAMAIDQPFGVGLFNFEPNFNTYDFLHGQYGLRRSVHSSHFQVLAETGFIGALAWVWQFAVAIVLVFRIRGRARRAVDPEDQRIYATVATMCLASMMAFLVGGAFIALALNDITWITFGLLAAADLLSQRIPQRAPEASPVVIHPFSETGAGLVRAPVTAWR